MSEKSASRYVIVTVQHEQSGRVFTIFERDYGDTRQGMLKTAESLYNDTLEYDMCKNDNVYVIKLERDNLKAYLDKNGYHDGYVDEIYFNADIMSSIKAIDMLSDENIRYTAVKINSDTLNALKRHDTSVFADFPNLKDVLLNEVEEAKRELEEAIKKAAKKKSALDRD